MIAIDQYRAAIGLFNRVKFIRVRCSSFFGLIGNILAFELSIILILILVLSGDVELNPGPYTKLRTCNFAFTHSRSMSHSTFDELVLVTKDLQLDILGVPYVKLG